MKATPAIAATRVAERCVEIFWHALAFVLLLLLAQTASAATARVQYLSSANVYLDAGRIAGLQEGSAVRVERDGEVVAELVVQFVAEHSAACTIRSSKTALRAGDLCVFEPAGGSASPAGNRPAGVPPVAPGGFDWMARMRGSLAMGFTQATESGGTFRSATFRTDAWWSGRGEGQFGLRLRGSRPETALSDATTSRIRLEEASAHVRSTGGRAYAEIGRFFATGLESMGRMDGGALRVRPGGVVEFALAGGAVPEDIVSGGGSSGWKAGVLLEVHDPRRTGPRRWRASAGVIRIDDVDVTRRQFVLQRADARIGTRLRVAQNLELEVNPGWKRALGEPQFEIASTSLSTQITMHPRVDVVLGADSRRDLLLPEHRHFEVPIARERTHGLQASSRFGVTRHVSIRGGAGMRMNAGGSRRSTTWDASFDAANLGSATLGAMGHVHGYEVGSIRGTVVGGTLRWAATRRVRLDAGAGISTVRAASDVQTTTSWLHGGVDLDIGTRTWIAAQGEIRADSGGDQFTVHVGRRF